MASDEDDGSASFAAKEPMPTTSATNLAVIISSTATATQAAKPSNRTASTLSDLVRPTTASKTVASSTCVARPAIQCTAPTEAPTASEPAQARRLEQIGHPVEEPAAVRAKTTAKVTTYKLIGWGKASHYSHLQLRWPTR